MSKRRKKENKEKKPVNIEVKNVNIITEEKQSYFKNTKSLILNGLHREINISDEEIAYTDEEKKLTLWENKGSSKLNTLLITISFNKLKSSTFKRFNGSSLFQVILQDGNDRFQLNVALFIVLIKNYFHFNKILILILVTTATDWIQQMFIVRYNNINIDVYNTYKEVLMQDYSKNGIIKRFGMPVDGHIVGCIVLLYRRNISLQSWGLFIVLFLVAKVVCLYILERLLLVYECTDVKGIDKNTTRFIKGLSKETDVSVESMSKVIRYEMNGKKIF
ncbi:unnamed protein product [Hanseniaspora opuntiae]